MAMPKDQIQGEIVESWRTYLDALEKSLVLLEEDIRQAGEMAGTCTDEWCEATEHYIDDISNALFTISEPRWASQEDSKKIKNLRKKVRELYADYRDVYKQVH
ncbi:MAG: hypothetical protein C4530_10385 [Desulfobacteraceae bacterium]|nr:MAG: hypothetical protein C4530_10385 [Desulfobacteraceae bacterium]